jgi:hypothetical protein
MLLVIVSKKYAEPSTKAPERWGMIYISETTIAFYAL